MRSEDVAVVRKKLDEQLRMFAKQHPLPGMDKDSRRNTLIEQLIKSMRQIRHVSAISSQKISPLCSDPSSDCFNPLKSAILHQRHDDMDEAFWMVFLFVHFGKNHHTGWRSVRDVYGRLGRSGRWDWATVSKDPQCFRKWLVPMSQG